MNYLEQIINLITTLPELELELTKKQYTVIITAKNLEDTEIITFVATSNYWQFHSENEALWSAISYLKEQKGHITILISEIRTNDMPLEERHIRLYLEKALIKDKLETYYQILKLIDDKQPFNKQLEINYKEIYNLLPSLIIQD